MRSATPFDLIGYCPKCFFREKWCICEKIPTIHTDISFLILRHTKEVMKSSNTGRLAHLALPNSQLLTYGERGKPFVPSTVCGEDTWLLFATNDNEEILPLPKPPKKVLVLDGTWRQARRMFYRMPEIRNLPRIGLPKITDIPERIRTPHQEWMMSTVEAIARTIELYDSAEKAKQLDELFAYMVQQFRLQRGWERPQKKK